jgi:signal transduction histidine kinase
MRRHGWALAAGAGVVAALLVLLGVLQVRWLDQVAQTITAQKRAALHREGNALALDLERELTRAFFWFHLDRDEARAPADLLGERWKSWRQASPHPALLAAVWLAESEGPGGAPARLRRLGPAGALEAADWPPALAPLRGFLGDDFHIAGLLPTTETDQAWLAIPQELPGSPGGSLATVLLQLDGQHLVQGLLPALAEARGKDRDEGGPIVARLEDAAGRPLFGPGPVQPSEHDPIVIRGFRPDLLTAALFTGMQPPPRWPPDGPSMGPMDPPPPHHRAGVGAGLVFGFGPGPGLPSTAPLFTRQRPPGAPRPTILRARFPGPMGGRAGPPEWRLALSFAAGPVDGLVTSLRRRNLAVGFSLLTLLGAAIAALSLAVRRAHALAERQRQFMASVSHELRTPLAVIGAAAENLRDGTVDDAGRVREYGTMIHTEGKRLGAMMDHLLRLAAGKDLRDELRLRPVDLRAVVDRALDSFAQELAATGGRIERSDPPDAAMVCADPEALRQAVENVVGNALKYGGAPPRVEVRISRSEAPTGTEVLLAVEDRGMGIPPDEVGHVFEPFFRGREALARQIRGTGLGLALVARVMEAHGGAVSCRSTPGQGSVFVLRLPSAPAEDAPA